jgi:hypothetical protein
MRIEDPSVLETGLLSLTGERNNALYGHIWLNGDAEPHVFPGMRKPASLA